MTSLITRHTHTVDQLSVFLVEDSPVIRQNLISTLEEMLCVRMLGTADDAKTAITWLDRPEALGLDIMIIDVFLRSGTGLDVIAQARQKLTTTRLIVLTNYATLDMRRRCLQLGADKVFDKSAEVDELLDYCQALASAKGSGTSIPTGSSRF